MQARKVMTAVVVALWIMLSSTSSRMAALILKRATLTRLT